MDLKLTDKNERTENSMRNNHFMKTVKTALIVIVLLISSVSAYCQKETRFNEKLSVKRIVGDPDEKIKEENFNLQSFVESIYINSSKFHYQALPNIEQGEYLVLINQDDGLGGKPARSKDLKNISKNEIKALTYEKSPKYSALYGTFAGTFGLVTINLKAKESK